MLTIYVMSLYVDLVDFDVAPAPAPYDVYEIQRARLNDIYNRVRGLSHVTAEADADTRWNTFVGLIDAQLKTVDGQYEPLQNYSRPSGSSWVGSVSRYAHAMTRELGNPRLLYSHDDRYRQVAMSLVESSIDISL